MLSCKEATRRISEGMERSLTRWQRIGLRLHLLMCRSCSAFQGQVRALDGLVRRRFSDTDREPSNPRGSDLSSEAKQRIAKELENKLGS